MTTTMEGWTSVLECNRVVWNRLLAWELLLFQLVDSKYRSDEKFMAIIQFSCQLFERDFNTSLIIEESGLYAHVEEEIPRLRGLVNKLRAEHAALRKHLEIIHSEFSDDASFDRPGLLRASVAELAQALRAHMRREEKELIPALLKQQQPASEGAPGRIGPHPDTSRKQPVQEAASQT